MCHVKPHYMVVLLALVLSAGCETRRQPIGGATGASAEAFVPGLGELMSSQQMRHVKLWFAGEAANWELADYELDELGEGFDDIVKYHPTHKDSPVAPKDAIPRMMPQPLTDLRTTIKQKNTQAFAQAFDALTKACNDCHQATNFGFNRVQRPASNPYPNQVFTTPTPR